MILLRDNYNFFKLDIIGYEFQESSFEEDLNWLNLRIEVKDEYLEWNSVGSYLRAEELVELLEWLVNITYQNSGVFNISFLERELSFGFDVSKMILTIKLDYNFHPKVLNYNYEEDEEYCMSFKVSNDRLQEIMDVVRGFSSRFPVRASSADAKSSKK